MKEVYQSLLVYKDSLENIQLFFMDSIIINKLTNLFSMLQKLTVMGNATSVPAPVDTPVSDVTTAVDSQNIDNSSTLLPRRPGDISALVAADASQNDVTLQEASVTRAKSRDVMDFEHLKMKLDQLTGTAGIKKDVSGAASVPQVAVTTVKIKADVDSDLKESSSDGTMTSSSSVLGTNSSSINRSATTQQTAKAVLGETDQHGVMNTQQTEHAIDAVSPANISLSIVTTQTTSANTVSVSKVNTTAVTHQPMPTSQIQSAANVPVAQDSSNVVTTFEQGIAAVVKPVVASGSFSLVTSPLPVSQSMPPVLVVSGQAQSSLPDGLGQQRVASPVLAPGHHPATSLTAMGTATGVAEHVVVQAQLLQQQVQQNFLSQVGQGQVIPAVVSTTPGLMSNSGSMVTSVYADSSTTLVSAPNSPKSNQQTSFHVSAPSDLAAYSAIYQQLYYQWMMQQAMIANAVYPANPSWPMFGNPFANSNPLLAPQLPFPTQMLAGVHSTFSETGLNQMSHNDLLLYAQQMQSHHITNQVPGMESAFPVDHTSLQSMSAVPSTWSSSVPLNVIRPAAPNPLLDQPGASQLSQRRRAERPDLASLDQALAKLHGPRKPTPQMSVAGGPFLSSPVTYGSGTPVACSPLAHQHVCGTGHVMNAPSPVISPTSSNDRHLTLAVGTGMMEQTLASAHDIVVATNGVTSGTAITSIAVTSVGIQSVTDKTMLSHGSETEKLNDKLKAMQSECKELTEADKDFCTSTSVPKRKLQFFVSAVKNDPLKEQSSLAEDTLATNSASIDSKRNSTEVISNSNKLPSVCANQEKLVAELSTTSVADLSVTPAASMPSASKVPVKKGRFRILDVKEKPVVSSPLPKQAESGAGNISSVASSQLTSSVMSSSQEVSSESNVS